MPELSPVPRDAIVDRSGGAHAHVTHRAVRRYAERALGLGEDMLDGVEDRDAVEVLRSLGVPVAAVRDRLAYYGGVLLAHGAAGIVIDGLRLMVVEDWNAGETRAACDAMLKWNRAASAVMPGLSRRRTQERALCLKGI